MASKPQKDREGLPFSPALDLFPRMTARMTLRMTVTTVTGERSQPCSL